MCRGAALRDTRVQVLLWAKACDVCRCCYGQRPAMCAEKLLWGKGRQVASLLGRAELCRGAKRAGERGRRLVL